MAYISSERTLQEMRHLSLVQRAALIKERLGLQTFSHSALHDYYRRLGVRFVKPQVIY